MEFIEKYIWLPLLLLLICIGMALPSFVVDFADDSRQERIWIGMFICMAAFNYSIFKKIVKKYPKLENWCLDSYIGVTITLFFGSLIASSLSAFFAILPFPFWLHIVFGCILAFIALGIMVSVE